MNIANNQLSAQLNPQPLKAIYVVGSKFKDFCDYKSVWDYQTAIDQLPRLSASLNTIIMGQGISDDANQSFQECLKFIDKHNDIQLVEHISKKVSKDKVHKAKQCNVMVSMPTPLREGVFSSHLIVDENCAEMSDHQTGEHVQGALLIEAARQMFMACATSFELDAEVTRKIGQQKFALSEMKVTFHNFVFPIATRIELHFKGAETRDNCADGFCEVKFIQNDKLCCEVFCAAKVFSEKMLQVLETRSAKQARSSLAMA
jgi:hypothetical protein